jgi:threonine dehydratase
VPAVDFDLVERVMPLVRPRVQRTPLVRSEWLSKARGGEVWLKCENRQTTGSFKVRGPFAKLLDAGAPPDGVVAASAGNHGLGLAHASRELSVRCRIFVPRTIPEVKERKIRDLGAELVKAPFDGYDDTEAYARERAGNALWVSPYDDPHIMAGNGGTTAIEILEEVERFDAVVVPCGGGGLAIGLGVVLRRVLPDAAVIGVNSEASPGMWLSRREHRAHERLESRPTIAEGIEGGVSANAYRLGLKYIDDVVCVSEDDIARAVVETRRESGEAIEGSAGAAVAALLGGKVPRERQRLVVVLTGSNIDAGRLAELERRYG